MAIRLNITQKVRDLLIKFPETMDNDNLLILKVWAEENPSIRNKDYKFRDFAFLFRDGKFSPPETIRRTRAKLQEEYENLRGPNYEIRKSRETLIKKDFKNI